MSRHLDADPGYRPLPPRLLRSCLLLALVLATAPCSTGVAAAAELQIVAFGDSLTVGLFDAGDALCADPNVGYPPRLANRLAERGIPSEVVNAGECGEVTLDGVSRLDEVLEDNPDASLVILMEGTNDLAQVISVESMRFNIAQMTNKVLQANMQAVVASPPPRNPTLWGSNDRGAFLSGKIEDDAAIGNIEFANQFDRFDAIDTVYGQHYAADGLHLNSSGYHYLTEGFLVPVLDAIDRLGPAPCHPSTEAICLSDDIFQVEVAWRDPTGETGRAKVGRLTEDTAYFWFFSEENIELVVKVLDGREFNDHYWVFYGALSNVEYTIYITDSRTGHRRIYFNPQGDQASVSDTDAFPGHVTSTP